MPTINIKLTNYNFNIPKGKNIVVLANYRTGSTALCKLLSNITGYINLDEDFHRTTSTRGRFKNTQGPSIVKIMPDQIPGIRVIDELFDNAFVIGLYRRNFPAQVVSWITCIKTNQWHNELGRMVSIPKDLKICPADIETHALHIYQCYLDYVECGEYMDTEMCYEELLPDLHLSGNIKTPRVDEYQQQIDLVKSMLPLLKIPYYE